MVLCLDQGFGVTQATLGPGRGKVVHTPLRHTHTHGHMHTGEHLITVGNHFLTVNATPSLSLCLLQPDCFCWNICPHNKPLAST